MLTIITNNVPRDILYAWDLTEKEKAEFDYLFKSLSTECCDNALAATFFRYKGQVYDLGEITSCDLSPSLQGWNGYHSDSFFSGIVVKYPTRCDDDACDCENYDAVIVGRYYS